MTSNNEECKYDEKFLKSHKTVKHIINGFTHLFILWIIKKRGPIHGYGIMKELDVFLESLINKGAIKKSSSSKIYPLLKKMEEDELIAGVWETQNNKKVKFYKITEKGENKLKQIKKAWLMCKKNPNWIEFINDMLKEDEKS